MKSNASLRSGSSPEQVEKACIRLRSRLPNQVFNDNPSLFWDTKQNELVPALRIEPSTTEDVSVILKILVEENCHFAIRSGGLARGAGSSNAGGGVTIDLVRLNDVKIAEDRKSVQVGAGGRWFEVYSKLDPHGLTVMGGRMSMVGVGGFLLGGGISFLSQRWGWSCDSIISYEVVLPNGQIVTADNDNHPDLSWALRGAGSSNFGIVTSFVMKAFELPNPKGIWLRINVYTHDKVPSILDRMQKVWAAGDKDLVQMTFYPYDAKDKTFSFVSAHVHTTHDDPRTEPKSISSLADIESIAGTPEPQIVPIATSTAIIASGARAQTRGFWLTFTSKPSREFDSVLYATFEEEVVKLKDVQGFAAKLTTQLLPPATNGDGKNCLGLLSNHNAPLIVINCLWSYDLPGDARIVEDTASRCFSTMKAKAQELNVWQPFKYMNYADERFQAKDVWDGYGAENLARLRNIQKIVDPTGVFTRGGLASGYFKLNSLNGSLI